MAIVIPEDIPEVYANFLQVFITEWDFLLVIGSTHLGTDEANKLTPTARADVLVRMSPQHAKATLRTLQTLVQEFEDKYGPIGREEARNDATKPKATTPRQGRRRNTV